MVFASLLFALATAIAAPDDWRKESFEFPLRFAPAIPYEGTELVRFHPHWAQFDKETGFSYVFMWDVKTVPVEPADLEDNLETYFNGLMENVARGRKLDPPARAVVAAHPMAPLPGWRHAFGVEIRGSNAFSKNEPLLLYGEVTQRECPGGRMEIFFAISQSARDRPVWDVLRSIRAKTSCGTG
jgi:hypothetical protein